MLGLSYTLLVYSTYTLVRRFTAATICGMNREVTGAHILLSLSHLSPDTGTGSHYLNRTLVGFLAQHPFKRASQRLTPLHTCDLAILGASLMLRLVHMLSYHTASRLYTF
jgi:hypothetical protein